MVVCAKGDAQRFGGQVDNPHSRPSTTSPHALRLSVGASTLRRRSPWWSTFPEGFGGKSRCSRGPLL